MSFDRYRWPKAAKQHRCEWCGESVHVGEVHAQFVGSFEGEFQSWRMHKECQKAWETLSGCEQAEGFDSWSNERPSKETQ